MHILTITAGHHLIAYVKSWQTALNETATTNGTSLFQFNTYTISVLVIYFLQLNNQFPKLANVPVTNTKFIDNVPHVNEEEFKRAVIQFFEFYSNKYQMKNHIISIDIGRWKNRRLESQQSNFSPEEERFVILITYCYIELFVLSLCFRKMNISFFAD